MAARNQKNLAFFSSYISGPEHAVNSEQRLYYSSAQKIIVTDCFNFIGAAKAELEPASLDLLIPVLIDDHQVRYRTAYLTIILDSDSCYYQLYDRSM